MIELKEDLIDLKENVDSRKETSEVFEKLRKDRYWSEKKVTRVNSEMYQSLIKEINNLLKYLEKSKIIYEKDLERIELELNRLK